MADGSPPTLGPEELKFRYYDARLGVWKVVLGTLIIGLAGIIFPFAVQMYNSYFENERKTVELKLSEQSAHQQYIKEFFSTAINQDIELRIRFAEYFAYLSRPGSDQEILWKAYLSRLVDLRTSLRADIGRLELEMMVILSKPKDNTNAADLDRVKRHLAWAYAEIGYAPIERSTVAATAADELLAKKLKLYPEAIESVKAIANSNTALNERTSDLDRFWQLYKKDLIGVESREFARIMIAIGNILKDLTEKKLPPTDNLKDLLRDLEAQSTQELEGRHSLCPPWLVRTGQTCVETWNSESARTWLNPG